MFTPARSTLALLISLTLQSRLGYSQATATASGQYASTTNGAMKPVGCFSSSGDFTNQNNSIYQSSKNCESVCGAGGLGKAAFGLQGGDCWCGDLMPPLSSQVGNSHCSETCFGWHLEFCGGTNAWTVWLTGAQDQVGYVGGGGSIGSDPSSSSGGSPSATTSDDYAFATSAPGSASYTEAPTTPSSTPDSTSDPSTTAAAEVTSAATSAAKAASTVLATVTVSGSVQTIVSTTIAEPTGSTSFQSSTGANSSAGPNKVGIAVGVVVGVLALAAIIGAVVYYTRRRNKAQSTNRHSRQSSMDVFKNRQPALPNIRASTMNDSRLDPRVMVDKRQSSGSMFADNVDYSRRILTVTNPDG